jgi:hypothetical protein
MPDAKKRPCKICRKWFRPDVRVGDRQRTCGQPECQKVLRKRALEKWRSRNRDYFIAWRIQARCQSERGLEPLRLPHPLSNLPWDIAHDEFGVKGADFIGVMGAVLLQAAKNQLKRQVVDSKGDSWTLPLVFAKNQFQGQIVDSS